MLRDIADIFYILALKALVRSRVKPEIQYHTQPSFILPSS